MPATLSQAAKDLLSKPYLCHFVTLNPDGSPQITPVWVDHDGADAHIDKLAKKYLGKDVYPFRRESEQRVILRIQPDRIVMQPS